MSLFAQFCGFVVCAFIGLLGLTIIVWIWQGKIDLSGLVSEASGSASISRFQLLVITFVLAISLFGMVHLRLPTSGFPDIPRGALILLAISAATFIVSKGISYSQPQMLTPIASDSEGASHRQPRELLPLYLFLALVALLGYAAYRGELSASKAALLALAGGLTVWFIAKFLGAVDADGPPQLDTNWGGLGGGIGGWRCSASLVYLLCSFVLSAVVIAAFFLQAQKQEARGNVAAAASTAGTSEKKAAEQTPSSTRQNSLELKLETK